MFDFTEYNMISTNVSGVLPNVNSSSSNLSDINLSFNRLRDRIPSLLFNIRNLKNMDLSHNRFTDDLGTLPQKQHLDVPDSAINLEV